MIYIYIKRCTICIIDWCVLTCITIARCRAIDLQTKADNVCVGFDDSRSMSECPACKNRLSNEGADAWMPDQPEQPDRSFVAQFI